jgi:hypothetical protein
VENDHLIQTMQNTKQNPSEKCLPCIKEVGYRQINKQSFVTFKKSSRFNIVKDLSILNPRNLLNMHEANNQLGNQVSDTKFNSTIPYTA